VVGVPSSFLGSISSGTRRSLTFPHLQPTFRALRQVTSNFPQPLQHSAIQSSIFRDLSRPFRSRSRLSSISPHLRFTFSTLRPEPFRQFFSIIIDSPRARLIHSSTFFDIPRHPLAFPFPPFLNRLFFNRVRVPQFAVKF
jgi:hypothetical protein